MPDKIYPDFPAVVDATDKIFLLSDPVTGELFKVELSADNGLHIHTPTGKIYLGGTMLEDSNIIDYNKVLKVILDNVDPSTSLNFVVFDGTGGTNRYFGTNFDDGSISSFITNDKSVVQAGANDLVNVNTTTIGGVSGVEITSIPISGGADEFSRVKCYGGNLILTAFHLLLQKNGSSIDIYPDNAAAVAGGLAVDTVYKTATGELRIVV